MGEHKIVRENLRFGRYLRRIREDRKLSLDAVEEMTTGYPEPVTKSHLSRIENGRAVPTFPRMFALCQVYGVPISSMAERFETDLRRVESASVDGLTRGEIFERLTELRNCGRYDAALDITTGLMEQLRDQDAGFEMESSRRVAEWHVNCLVHLDRFETAKIQCENLLGVFPEDSRQHLNVLLSFIQCSYRLGRFTVALMGLHRVDTILSEHDWPPRVVGIVETVRGPAFFTMGVHDRAAECFERVIRTFGELGDPFEVCRARINLGTALIELGKLGAALRHLVNATRVAEKQKYTRLQALGLSCLAVVHYRKEDLESAEKYAIRSNGIARRQDYLSLVFKNSFYLWRCASRTNNRAAAVSHEKSLRALENRLRDDLPELEEYRRLREGGDR
jgi:transcriptional regulator with XRE-family HTH domain